MENHSIVWVGMDTDAKGNQVALYRGWEKEPSGEWKAGGKREARNPGEGDCQILAAAGVRGNSR